MEKFEWGYQKDAKSDVIYMPIHDCDLEGAKKFIALRRRQIAQYEPYAQVRLFIRSNGEMVEIPLIT